ncbi:MAG: nucleoside hydrolase [Armatimonadetes bacterium]|nr:nucleoside hydrolase [Armatimonadota bacterium]
MNCCEGAAGAPVKMIFDTDIGNDIDDALALAMIHTLADRGEVELLAVTVSKDNPWAGVYVDVVNRFYGRPRTPIGTVRDGKTPDDGYARVVAERRDGKAFAYPRRLGSGADAPEAVSLLRKTLAAQPDGSVVIVSVGFMTNLARLLDSKPDKASPLTGMELVKAKVREYVMMAGAFGPDPGGEYNVVQDAESARRVFERWPTPIAASGFEIGAAILYPAESIEKDYGWVKNHPVAEAYRAYMKMPYDRPTWDLTAVLYAVRPDRGYFGVSPNGRITMDEKNVTRFTADEKGRHRYLTVTPDQITRVREACVFLASAPPTKRR